MLKLFLEIAFYNTIGVFGSYHEEIYKVGSHWCRRIGNGRHL